MSGWEVIDSTGINLVDTAWKSGGRQIPVWAAAVDVASVVACWSNLSGHLWVTVILWSEHVFPFAVVAYTPNLAVNRVWADGMMAQVSRHTHNNNMGREDDDAGPDGTGGKMTRERLEPDLLFVFIIIKGSILHATFGWWNYLNVWKVMKKQKKACHSFFFSHFHASWGRCRLELICDETKENILLPADNWTQAGIHTVWEMLLLVVSLVFCTSLYLLILGGFPVWEETQDLLPIPPPCLCLVTLTK